MKEKDFRELASLFFTTRQIIRSKLPSDGSSDPNAWHQHETLRYIGEQGNPTMQDVAQYVRVKAPSATSLIAHLASRGLVSRRKEARDKRVVRICLTERGKKELRAYEKRCVTTMQKVFSELSTKETRELARALRRLRDIHGPNE